MSTPNRPPPRKGHNALPPRGIRNNNPGNILRAGQNWRGLSPDQPDGEFCKFIAPEWGLRALILVLHAYRRRGIVTVRDIIRTYCPPTHRFPDGRTIQQDTAAYVRFVAGRLGVPEDATINVTSRVVLRLLLPAIVTKENGQQPYGTAVFETAMDLAKVAKEP
jgi:hypothetical protein